MIQIAPAILIVWFICFSTQMSCSASGEFAGYIFIVLTLTCISHLSAVVYERKWNLINFPILMWVVCVILTGAFVH
jgi:hypothetical protein